MTIGTRQITAEELLRMPDDGSRHELVEGELRRYVKANDLGRTYAAETGFRISSNPGTVRASDAAFVGRERVEEAGRVTGY